MAIATITLANLRTWLRIRLRDKSTPYLWTDNELDSFINRALRLIVSETECIELSDTIIWDADYPYATLRGSGDSNLSAYYMAMYQVYHYGVPLDDADPKDFPDTIYVGTPTKYYLRQGRIYLDRIPTSDVNQIKSSQDSYFTDNAGNWVVKWQLCISFNYWWLRRKWW